MCRSGRGAPGALLDEGELATLRRVATLHRGPGAVVFRARDTDGKTFIVKKYMVDLMGLRETEVMRREMRLLQECQSIPGVVRVVSMRETALSAYVIMEDCTAGDLYGLLRRSGTLEPEWVARHVMAPLLKTIAALHARGIVHRDLKPENVLLHGARGALLCDFGLAIDQTRELPFLRAGTLDYLAPEIAAAGLDAREGASALWEGRDVSPADLAAAGVRAYDEKVDVWALGALAYELVMGQTPHFSSCERATERNILAGKAPYVPLRLLRSDWADFVRRALALDPAARPSAEELLRHPWLAGLGAAAPGRKAASAVGAAPRALHVRAPSSDLESPDTPARSWEELGALRAISFSSFG
ncbi:hypothetical protein QBZ16_004645 [Prototheca wickerhamii]|uniref:Protein kinase domain-containing protein n=1 Tax=Prototheca wickerhamii TaxID=3111 RepID=A0AAD9IKD4_PROWI|nr:hypothetical protein QBZ16_004645 [Prototheca wickerhamii]